MLRWGLGAKLCSSVSTVHERDQNQKHMFCAVLIEAMMGLLALNEATDQIGN